MTRELFGSILFQSCLTNQSGYGRSAVVSSNSCSLSIVILMELCKTYQNPSYQYNLKSKHINSCSPRPTDVRIVNGMFFLHLFVDYLLRFGPLAMLILQQICKQRITEIHLVIDKNPSIKGSESNKRGNNRQCLSNNYHRTKPAQ